MESTDATTTSAAAATDGIQRDTATHDATAGDATTYDSDTIAVTDGNKRDTYAPNAIWSTTTAATAEYYVTFRRV